MGRGGFTRRAPTIKNGASSPRAGHRQVTSWNGMELCMSTPVGGRGERRRAMCDSKGAKRGGTMHPRMLAECALALIAGAVLVKVFAVGAQRQAARTA